MLQLGDRLISWGLDIPPTCLLCGVSNESSAHLFFECEFSLGVWNGLLSRSRFLHPHRLQDIILWLSSFQGPERLKGIFHLVFQATIYHLWKERNSRLHNNVSRSANLIMKDIMLQLRSKLYALDREGKTSHQTATSTSHDHHLTFLYIWFDRFQG